jgi:putative acetyltransferase
MFIRPETPADYPAIAQLLLAAFENEPHSRQTEPLIVETLRKEAALTLALVAEEQGALLGHIAFSPARINGDKCDWYILGPVAVTPPRQRQGIGAALIREGLRQLRQMNAKGCALVGHPGYYGRFGFQHLPGLTMEGVPAEVFFCLPMGEPVPKGSVTHHPAFFAGL